MNKKRIASLLLALFCFLHFFACTEGKTDIEASEPAPASPAAPHQPTEEPAETALPEDEVVMIAAEIPKERTTEIPTEIPTEQPTETPRATEAPAVTLRVQEPTDAETLSARITEAGSVAAVEIDDGALSNADLEALLSEFPNVTFRYAVKLGDAYVPCDAEQLDLSQKKISDVDELKRTLGLLPQLNRVEMIGCKLGNAAMADLCDAYPAIKFVWEIDLGYWGKLRTDATAFSTRSNKTPIQVKNKLKSAKETDCVQYIRYCTDLVALDLGHQSLTDVTFLRPLKKLRVLILADNYVSDISVLAELPELEYVELFMNRVSDLSPLRGLKKLRDLNIRANKVSDFTPLCEIKTLERVWYAGNEFKKSDHEMLQEALPGCILNHTSKDATSEGWRFDEKGNKVENYQWMLAFFEGAPRFD